MQQRRENCCRSWVVSAPSSQETALFGQALSILFFVPHTKQVRVHAEISNNGSIATVVTVRYPT